MKGGLYIPPNPPRRLELRQRLPASMKGGLYIPPNQVVEARHRDVRGASMKGGLYIPPNLGTSVDEVRESMLQ